jgi:perosamine synthetase
MKDTKYVAQIEPWIDQEEIDAVVDVMKSGWITEAKKTAEFEQMIAEFVGTKYASVMSNGTVTLFAGLAALGVGNGDEVIVPDFTMVASPNAIHLVGAKPVFVDIERDTLCLDLDDVEKKITKKTKAIMPVALNGRYPDMKRLLQIAKDNKLYIIEDTAQALGCYYKKKHLGTFGEIGSFSFSTPKVITTAQGGALVTNDKSLYEKIVQVKDFGRIDRNTQNHDAIGYNFKFTDIQAAVGVVQMKKLAWRLQRKKEMFALYQKELREVREVTFLDTNLTETSPWFIDIFIPDPQALAVYLKTKRIGTRIFYPAIHKTKPYRTGTVFKNSLWASTHGLWLPSSTFLSDQDILNVCNVIRDYYKDNK